jgi:hypothetical protein
MRPLRLRHLARLAALAVRKRKPRFVKHRHLAPPIPIPTTGCLRAARRSFCLAIGNHSYCALSCRLRLVGRRLWGP